jgi:flagellar biosynthetic protein FlhB
MAEDDDSKTEEPTSKRLSKAREEGDVIQSAEIKTASMLLAITVLVWFILPPVMGHVQRYLASLYADLHVVRVGTVPELQQMLGGLAIHIAFVMVIPLGFLFIVGLVAAIGQTGWILTFEKLLPDLGRISPMRGFSRIFSMTGLVEFGKNILKVVVMFVLFYFVLRPKIKMLPILPSMELMAILNFLHDVLIRLLCAVVGFVVALAGADYLYQRFVYMKKMRMTKQEVKDEHRQTEGDPMVKARIRSLRVQRARQRMMAAVPKADVVITNPTHFACALKYDPDTMNAPTLIAKGQDLVALRIRELAEQHDISIIENPPLARALYAAVDIDREIPPEHYKAVAEVISYVFRLKGKLKKR